MKFSEEYPKISVITPNFNQGDFIEATIKSVLDQDYPNLEYIIIDGGSKDNSLEIIEKYQNRLSYWISEPDEGMYDALNKGFSKSTGDIMCWINSDDVLWEKSLEIIASIFTLNANVHWLQGYPSVIDEQGKLLYQRKPIFSELYFYLLKHEASFSFIQQESTFWSRKLWGKIGEKLDLSYQFAADFDLWMRFYKYEKLYCSNQQLAAFRKREGQKSSNKKVYLNETKTSLKKSYKELSFVNKIMIRFLRPIDKLSTKSQNKFLKKVCKKIIVFFIGKPKIV